MDVPTELITAAVLAATGAIVTNTARTWRIGNILNRHIADEKINDKRLRRRLRSIEMRLPNGELKQTLSLVTDIHKLFSERIQADKQ